MYRNTPQRAAILESLRVGKKHPSADEVYRYVKEAHPGISLATVYKTLEFFRKKGIVRELGIDPGRRRYDYDTRDHHHFICGCCGKIDDINSSFKMLKPMNELRNYRITGSSVEFHGICPVCLEGGGV